MNRLGDDDATTRVVLSRGELLHFLSFAESIDDFDNAAWWDRLVNKLARAIARIDERKKS